MSRNEILPCDSFYIIKWVQVENEIARSLTSNKKLFSEKLNLTTLDFTIRSLGKLVTAYSLGHLVIHVMCDDQRKTDNATSLG